MTYNVFSGTLNPTQSTQPTDDKPSLKWAWSHDVIQFKFKGPSIVSQE